MRSNYKRIGKYIQLVNSRNKNLEVTNLQGININKSFMPSVANINGVDLSKYKIVSKGQFAFNPMHVGRDEVLPISRLDSDIPVIVSPAYVVFKIKDVSELLPEYLMMWCCRSEFDRNAWFTTDSSVRGGFSWADFCDMELPVPSPEKQQEIVREYNVVSDRIKLNENLNQKLEAAAQAIYKYWFVDFEFPISKEYAAEIGKPEFEGKPYKSSGGEMVYCEEVDKEIPKGWGYCNLGDIANIIMGQSPSGSSYNQKSKGKIFYQGRTEFGFRYPSVKIYTTEPKRIASKGDILMSVRAPVGDINIATEECCIGRGLSSISNKKRHNSFLLYLMLNIRPMFDVSNDEGTIFGSINKDDLNNIVVINPDENAVRLFDSKVKSIDQEIFLKCNEIKNLEVFRGLLFTKMTKV